MEIQGSSINIQDEMKYTEQAQSYSTEQDQIYKTRLNILNKIKYNEQDQTYKRIFNILNKINISLFKY